MSHKAGTKIHKYTAEEFARIRRGDYLPGIDRRSQRYALERLHKRRVEMEMESPDHKKMSLEAVIVRLLDGEAK